MDRKLEELHRVRIERFRDRIGREILTSTVPMEARWSHCPKPVPIAERERLPYAPITEGTVWGKAWESAWFHLRGAVPSDWSGLPVVAQLDMGGEALVLSGSGEILQGLSNGSAFQPDFVRDIVPLFERCRGGEQVELWVEAAANSLFGIFTEPDPETGAPDRHGHFEPVVRRMRLATFDADLWALWLDLRVVQGLIKRLPEKSVRRARLLRATSEAIDLYAGKRDNLEACRVRLHAELQRPAGASELTVTAVGHAHIDTAWLWPVAETVRKCARTFASQLALMRTYPEYVFGASQAQHYAFVKEAYPELYKRVQDAVASGRWEVQGGMWVEADCNLASGESLVRQFLHGIHFFRDEFDVVPDNLWLPDVFGYSAALPQILRKAGMPYFLTQKISWNQFNDFPHTTFRWRGIDGSEVLAHFPPENTYCSPLDSESLIAGAENFREKDILPEFLCLFGMGDGGGGPKDESIEWGWRMANLEGTPRVRFGTARDFFARIAAYADRLPVWVGELYLELHRGTLTTQAEVKKANRSLENRLRAVEFLWSCLPLDGYPAAKLDAIWKTTLRNQFHDILPGSSIAMAYEVTHREHADALQACASLIGEAATRLLKSDADSIALVNPLHGIFRGAIPIPPEWADHEVLDATGRAVATQSEQDGAVAMATVPPYSFTTLRKGARLSAARRAAPSPSVPSLVLENDLVRYEFEADGTIARAVDKQSGRSILQPGQSGNVLTLYEDRPNNWDAWDVDLFYEGSAIESARAVRAEPLPDGPVRRGLRFELAIGSSEIVQTAILEEGSRQLTFDTRVSWRERHGMLRVAFPINVHADGATFDIQYGFIRRPAHRNTLWDIARFESVAHRYVDLSEPTHGVAVLNDGKYGHKVLDSTIDLNLLRSPTYPDPDADRGEHRFVYALYPHGGDLEDSDTIERAAALNMGVLVFPGALAPNKRARVWVEGAGLSMEALKKAEKDPSLVVRIVETRGRESRGTLHAPGARYVITEVNLLEWEDGPAATLSGSMEIVLRPFEIRTYRLRPEEVGR